MDYEAPYGSPGGAHDQTANYINGNPATGTMGSIPPAASIENPQREIVNLITDAGIAPTDADLHQLAKGVQGGRLVYGVDFGTTNVYSINVTPPLTAYAAGQRWGVKIGNTNSGPSTLNINGLGGRHIVYPSGAPLRGNEMLAGAVSTLIDDGANLQLQNVATNTLAAPKVYYVNSTTGDDTLYDGTSAAISGPHGPFRTHARALTASYSWNQNGFTIAILTADGTYGPIVCSSPPNGSGGIQIIGNSANPAAVLIHSTAGEAIMVQVSGYYFEGMRLQADSNGSPPHVGAGIRLLGAFATIRNIDFGACFAAHMFVAGSSLLAIVGAEGGDLTAFYNVSGDTPVHLDCGQNSLIELGQCKLNTIGARSIGIWALCYSNAVIGSNYSSQTIGGVVTGQKYSATMNGVISTGSGVNYFPGTVAGVVASGGQYS